MSGMKTHLEETTADAKPVELLRLQLEQCQRELEVCRLRLGELEQAEALLAGEKRILELVARGGSLPEILGAMCRLGEELSDGALVSILLVSADGKSLRHGAAPNLPKRYSEAIDGGLIGPRAGSCGTAVYRKETVVVSDIETDPLWDDYRHLALAEGLRACWSTPIFSTTREVLGTFALYCLQPASPTPEQQSVVEQFAHLASIAIERSQAQEALRRGEAYLAEAQRLSLTGSFGWCVSSGKLIWSKETFCILGYDQATKPTLELVLKRVHPEDVALVQQTIDRASHEESDFDFEHRLLMPDGSVKHVQVVARAVREESGKVEFVGAVMDITGRKQAAEALRASEKLARSQVEALTRTLDALAMESAPDRLVEHVLRTITKQLGAHSSSVWQRDEASGLIDFQFSFEDGKFVTKSDSVLAGISLRLPMEEFWPWPAVFRTGKPGLMEDIRELPFFPWQQRLISLGVVTILIVPMSIAGRVDAVIGVRFTQKRVFSSEELELAQALANQAMLAMQLTRLLAESRESAVIAERNRMARDIHDTLAQGFTGVIMQLEAAKGATTHGDIAEATNRIERASELARSSLGEARRSVRALRPRSLRNATLFMALDNLLKRMTEGTNLNADFHAEGDGRSIPADCEEGLLRITQEALTNAVKHANARNFSATLSVGANKIQLRLVDDGRGFDPHTEHEGFGLIGMKERVDRLGGEFIIRAKPDVGTEIFVELKNQPSLKPDNRNEQS